MISRRHGLALAVAGLLGFTAIADGSERRAGRIVTVAHTPSDMVTVPSGTFTMGPDTKELEDLAAACRAQLGRADIFCSEDFSGNYIVKNFYLVARKVHLDAFAIDRYEVTGAQYRACVAAGHCDVGPLVDGDRRYIRDEWPVSNVTWQDAASYCAWVGKRLPTEAEWEKAARGPKAFRWPWGNHKRKDGSNHGKGESQAMQYTHASVALAQQQHPIAFPREYAPDDSDGHKYAAAPGAMRWSDGPYGAFDMAGNVAEWVYDYYHSDGYDGLAAVNPVREVPDPSAVGARTIRGGSWAEPRFYGRTYYRLPAAPDNRSPSIGFRCARSLDR